MLKAKYHEKNSFSNSPSQKTQNDILIEKLFSAEKVPEKINIKKYSNEDCLFYPDKQQKVKAILATQDPISNYDSTQKDSPVESKILKNNNEILKITSSSYSNEKMPYRINDLELFKEKVEEEKKI